MMSTIAFWISVVALVVSVAEWFNQRRIYRDLKRRDEDR